MCRVGQPGRPHILVKTHGWSDDWDPSTAGHILLTHRHLAGVLASYHRVGWAVDIPDSYVREHQQWKVSFPRRMLDILSMPIPHASQCSLCMSSACICMEDDLQPDLQPARLCFHAHSWFQSGFNTLHWAARVVSSLSIKFQRLQALHIVRREGC